MQSLRESLSPEEVRCLASRLLLEDAEAAAPVFEDLCPVEGDETGERAKIEFFVEPRHRSLVKLAPPVPAARYYPKWLRDMDPHYHRVTDYQTFPPELKVRQNSTVKLCPAIIDFLRAGYVMPLWCDYSISLNRDGTFNWQTPNKEFWMTGHPRVQYETMPNEGFPSEIKFMSPWYCRTSPGYSIRILPCYYHFEYLWTAMPGMVHTDQHHTTHINVLFNIKEGQIVIPRGTPMVYVIPFRRERYDLEVREGTEYDVKLIDEYQAVARRFISGSNGYQSPTGHFS